VRTLAIALFTLWTVVLAATAAESPVLAPAAKPLRNDDVVRMLVAGRSVAGVIAAIRAADAQFDLSDEMAEELRLAGVPSGVIAAMAARQREIDKTRPRAAAAPEPVVPGKVAVVVTLSAGGAVKLEIPGRLGGDSAKALQLGMSDEERTVTDVALFLACRTPDHVPDQWRSESPLGRDFVSAARHRMLGFHPGAAKPSGKARDDGKSKGGERGRADREPPSWILDLPIDLRADVEPGTIHDLAVGIAIRVGDRYLEIAEARKDGFVPEEGGVPLRATVSLATGKERGALTIRFDGEKEILPPVH
jgi:hypothetical protein